MSAQGRRVTRYQGAIVQEDRILLIQHSDSKTYPQLQRIRELLGYDAGSPPKHGGERATHGQST